MDAITFFCCFNSLYNLKSQTKRRPRDICTEIPIECVDEYKFVKKSVHVILAECVEMASVQVVKTEMQDIGSGDTGVEGQQLITVQTPTDDQQLIMVTFSGSGEIHEITIFCKVGRQDKLSV